MIDSRLYEAFVAIADSGSISEAARELNESRATIGRRLERLEEALGTRLIQRTTRSLVLTRAGHDALVRVRTLLAQMQVTEARLKQIDDTPRGLLRVSIPPGNNTGLAEFIVGLLIRHGQMQMEVDSSTRHIDLIDEGFDVAVRAGKVVDPRVFVRPLTTVRRLLVCSVAYAQAHGVPTSIDDLKDHNCCTGFALGLRPARSWPLLGGGEVEVSGGLSSNDMHVLREAVTRGLGIACLPAVLVADELRDGTLIPILEDVVGDVATFNIVFPEREFIDPKVRLFIDEFSQYFSTIMPLRG